MFGFLFGLQPPSITRNHWSWDIRLHHNITRSKQMFDRWYKISRAKFGIATIMARNVSASHNIFDFYVMNSDEWFSTHAFFSVLTDSYTEIVNFVQGYIDNEINFNREDTCSKQCSDFRHVDYHICRNNTLCILNYLDKNKTRCDGEIRSCEFVESDMYLCPNVGVINHELNNNNKRSHFQL